MDIRLLNIVEDTTVMDFVQLTETQRRDFDENGYLIVRQALDQATIDRLLEGGDRLMESFEYEDYYAHRRPGLIQEEDAYASLVTNFVQLTETQRRDFDENGYLIVRQALDQATIDRLLEGGDRLMESFEYEDYYAHRRPGLIQEEDAYASLVTNSSTVPLSSTARS